MCRHATFDVPSEPRSAPATREFCRATLTVWDVAELVEDAVLLLSELVTNGLMHAGPPLRVAVSIDAAGLELTVSDGSTSPPTVRPLREDLDGDLEALGADAANDGIVDDRDPRLDVGAAGSVVGGRGMQLVVSLAGDWGVDLSGHGKSVWAAPAAAVVGSHRLLLRDREHQTGLGPHPWLISDHPRKGAFRARAQTGRWALVRPALAVSMTDRCAGRPARIAPAPVHSPEGPVTPQGRPSCSKHASAAQPGQKRIRRMPSAMFWAKPSGWTSQRTAMT